MTSPYVQHHGERLGIIKKQPEYPWMEHVCYEPGPTIEPAPAERPWLGPILLSVAIIAIGVGILLAAIGVKPPQL